MIDLARVLALVAFVPLVFFPSLVIISLLTGAIRANGLWHNSFDPAEFSPARVFQFLAALVAVGAAVIGFVHSGGTAFKPLPGWLLAVADGGNAIYLGTKWNSSRGT